MKLYNSKDAVVTVAKDAATSQGSWRKCGWPPQEYNNRLNIVERQQPHTATKDATPAMVFVPLSPHSPEPLEILSNRRSTAAVLRKDSVSVSDSRTRTPTRTCRRMYLGQDSFKEVNAHYRHYTLIYIYIYII